MFCGNCGKEIAEGKKFCPYCGNALAVASAPAEPIRLAEKKATIGKPKKERKEFRINKAFIAVLAEVVAIAFLIWGLMKAGNLMFGPERMVRTYMSAIAEDDWDTVLNLVYTKESEFVGRGALKNAISASISEDFDTYETSLREGRGGSAEVKVKYGIDGKTNNSVDLTVDKQRDKALFFFDTWKVSAENYMVENFTIQIPKGTSAYLDGLELPMDLMTEDYDNGAGSYDTFQLPEICTGAHQVAALVGNGVLSYQEMEINEDNETVVLQDIFPSTELQEKILDAACADFKKIMVAKTSANRFDTIQDLFVDADNSVESARNAYESSLDSYHRNTRDIGILNLYMKDVTGRVLGLDIDRNGWITSQVNIEYTYSASKIGKDFFDGTYSEYTDDDRSGNFYAYMVYDDGEWKLKEIQLPYGL